MRLKELLKSIQSTYSAALNTEQEILGLSLNSKEVQTGFLFVAVKGTQVDGHFFIESAFANGAVAVIAEDNPGNDDRIITVEDSSKTLSLLAASFYNKPAVELKLVGVTGTNGKTSVCTLLFDLFKNLGYKVGLLSTVEIRINDVVLPATHTTPDAISLNKYLRQMCDAGCDYCFMECSSHAIEQNRVYGLPFHVAVFTNITHDHLDYHKTFDNYIRAKKKLFDNLSDNAYALVNKDDKHAMVMLQNSKAAKFTYALNHPADFHAKIIEADFNAMLLSINEIEAWYFLVGKFNASNLLAVFGTAFLLGLSQQEIINTLSKVKPVKGRFEIIRSADKRVAIVDYAHTPDALKNILQSINELRSKNETLITVIGCGGDRDKEKRSEMGAIAAKLSDKVIFTSDNPRYEDPEQIIREIESGVPAQYFKKTLSISDRYQAIKTAVGLSKKLDIILIAGKGHENYQEIQGVKHPFNDTITISNLFNQLT
jgi:UDP-N-acetylmuramoyl-L-alanyl-D-glutamate--2,6-diaminopimelate ligase